LITGTVNVRREATIPLAVLGASPLEREIVAIIDTGFDGYLTLPPGTITDLRLAWLGRPALRHPGKQKTNTSPTPTPWLAYQP
jgi:predicted aspartyl protease